MDKSRLAWVLSRDNTAPFIVVSLTFFLFLSTPFIYFTYLKGQPHRSGSVDYPEFKESLHKDSLNIQGMSAIPLNKFDDEYEGVDDGSHTADVITNNVKDWKKDADSRGFIVLTRLAIFSIITAFGALGAAVSLITRTRNNEVILNKITISEILSVQIIGAVFACVLGLAFMGNMLAGTIFPNPSVFYRILYVPPAFAKLLVWSFVAGFSERFVPNVLGNLIKRANDHNEAI